MKPNEITRHNVPGRRRYVPKNRRPNAMWYEFALYSHEADVVMEAIGRAGDECPTREVAAGALLTTICREWMAMQDAKFEAAKGGKR